MPVSRTPTREENFLSRAEPGPRKANKRHIMACALACFDELGLEATTIEHIRERAGSSIGSIYHHFGNREGIIAALFLAALDDQLALIEPRMKAADTAKEAVMILVTSYLSWVTEQPLLARFMFRARHLVAAGPQADALAERNRRRYGALLKLLKEGVKTGAIRALPAETYAPLLIGPSENYCRAWLSGRVPNPPSGLGDVFAEAAWRSIAT